MKKHEIIEGLKSLIEDRKSFLTENSDDDIFFSRRMYLFYDTLKLELKQEKLLYRGVLKELWNFVNQKHFTAVYRSRKKKGENYYA